MLSKGTFMDNNYTGEVEVIPNDFEMFVKQLIVRDDSVALSLYGEDSEGDYTINATIPAIESGKYSGPVDVVYPHLNKPLIEPALISIWSITKHSDSDFYSASGEFYQNGYKWSLEFHLELS